MTLPDDDLESITDATDIHGNVGTRDHRGAKYGKSRIFKPRSKLQRIFASEKARATRKQNKAIAKRSAHD
jgi:hypothetical protein